MKFNILLLILFAFLFSCKNNNRISEHSENTIQKIVYDIKLSDSLAVMVADSVVYTVYLKNPDSLNQWRSYSLRYVDKERLVDLIFKSIYNGIAKTYSYRDWIFGDKVLIPIDSTQSLEKYKNRVGQIEFVERWFYNAEKNIFYKQVLEATLAYELYDNNGKVRGYAPLFKIIFSQSDNKDIAK